MKKFSNNNFYFLPLIVSLIVLFSYTSILGQANNNSYVFNGETSMAYVLDGQPVTTDANQNGFGYFNNSSVNNKISVQAWVYLIGDTPADVEVPIVYRKVDNGNTFSINHNIAS